MESHSHWVICAPEYNGSIPPILTNAIAWLSIQGTDFRSLFNERPIAIASFSGGGCMELLLSMRIQLTHLGALVLGRQLATNKSKINDLTRKKINTEKAMIRTYKNALFNSSCRVSPFGRFTIIGPLYLIYSYYFESKSK